MFQDCQINVESLDPIAFGEKLVRKLNHKRIVFVRNSTTVFVHSNRTKNPNTQGAA